MDSKFAVGQLVPYHRSAMQWIDVLIDIITEEAELLMHPAGIILIVCVFCMIGKLLFSKAVFEREKDQLLMQISKCNNVIATLRQNDEMHVRIHAIIQFIMHACIRVYAHTCACCDTTYCMVAGNV